MKKIFSLIAVALFAFSASADVIWSESLDKNGTYINKADFGNNWPYATQWYEAGNFVYAYDSVGSYGVSVRNKKLNGASENSIGFFFSKEKAAASNYLFLGGEDGAIVEGAQGCKLMFDICSSESNGGDLSTMIVKVNGEALPTINLALGDKLVTSAVEFALADGDIENIEFAFDNVPSQKFIANLRIEGEAGTAHGQGGITPPVEELDTISATEAKQRAEALEVGASEKVAILCYIASIKSAWNSTYNNLDLWLTDDPTSTYGVISTFRTKADAQVGPTLAAGDQVLIVGNIAHTTYEYEGETKHSYQVAEGAQLTLIEKAQGIEELVLTKEVKKVVVDGAVYVVRDGKLFNILGTQVR